LVELVPDFALIAVLDGPLHAAGVMILSQAIVAGFIEVQTIGRVRSQDLLPRKPTRTDGAMVFGVINAALVILEQSLSEDPDVVWAGGFRFSSFLDDPRPLPVVLEDMPLRLLTAEVALAGGLRKGKILFAVPAEGRFPMPFPEAFGAGDEAGLVFGQALQERVDGAGVLLDAVLARLSLPMADVLDMAAGMLVPLQDASLEAICVEGTDGRCVALGKLGQNRGMRALRVVDAQTTLARKATRAGRVFAAPSLAPLARSGSEAGLKPTGPVNFEEYLAANTTAQGAGMASVPGLGEVPTDSYDLRSSRTG
jgi:flagellar motor switch protein FliM